MGSSNWRSRLQPGARRRIVSKIVRTLKKYYPFSSGERLNEMNKIAINYEKKIYTCATSQSDYLRIISLKLITFEMPPRNSLPSNSGAH